MLSVFLQNLPLKTEGMSKEPKTHRSYGCTFMFEHSFIYELQVPQKEIFLFIQTSQT